MSVSELVPGRYLGGQIIDFSLTFGACYAFENYTASFITASHRQQRYIPCLTRGRFALNKRGR